MVVALIAGIVIFAVSRGSGSGPKADDVAVGYLQALAAGDADKALSYGSATPDRTFLTSDILKKQQAIAKITAVNVVGSESRGSEARVNMSYNFGSQAVTDYYALTKIKGKWKLQSTTASANVSSGRSIPGLTLFGTKVASDTVTTFPGPLQWGSSDPNYEVKPLGSADRFATSPGDSNFTSLQYQLSQAGTKTLSDAFTAKIAECLKIKTASAPGCPQRSFAFSAVPNSFVWKLAGTGTDGITYRSSYSDPKKIDLSGLLRFTVTYQSRNFDNKIESKTDDVTSFVSGSATLEGDTATITLN
ncbi:MAG: hypothetical protein M3140_03555 [Actinomycetota bacterium]|nr:hypothetical protein [Actinomycetota bacterium]